MKNLRLLFISISILSLPLSMKAQNLSTVIKVQAMEMGNSFMRNDFNNFVKYMHPNIVEFAGGKEKMKSAMDSAYQAMKRFKVKFKRYWIGSPGEIITYKNQLQAVLPQSTTMAMGLGEMTIETSMIAISADKGKTWWFIDTNAYQAEKLKNIMPDLSPNLVIPPPKKPTFAPRSAN